MTKDKSIYIKNIYYMLTYAFQVLKQNNYEEIASEEFESIQDLFAAILSKGVAQQLKQGLYREYTSAHESLSVIRGKIDMPETMKNRILHNQKAVCEFDEFSENNLYNQIIKTTLHYLVRDTGVKSETKAILKRILLYFDGIDILKPSAIIWSRIHYQRNNLNYVLLLNVCYFVIEGMLQTTEKGEYRMMSFSDEHMARLYERFILEYYKQHHNYLSDIKSGQVYWDIRGNTEESIIRFLPNMYTDIMLKQNGKVLIIDAKYYGKTLQKHFDKFSLHSANVYQIYTYVKNQDRKGSGNVSGILLYAKTDEEITPDCHFNMGGNMIGAKTLDLNQEFSEIASKLDMIVRDCLTNE